MEPVHGTVLQQSRFQETLFSTENVWKHNSRHSSTISLSHRKIGLGGYFQFAKTSQPRDTEAVAMVAGPKDLSRDCDPRSEVLAAPRKTDCVPLPSSSGSDNDDFDIEVDWAEFWSNFCKVPTSPVAIPLMKRTAPDNEEPFTFATEALDIASSDLAKLQAFCSSNNLKMRSVVLAAMQAQLRTYGSNLGDPIFGVLQGNTVEKAAFHLVRPTGDDEMHVPDWLRAVDQHLRICSACEQSVEATLSKFDTRPNVEVFLCVQEMPLEYQFAEKVVISQLQRFGWCLSLYFTRDRKAAKGSLSYDTARFDADDMKRVATHVGSTLASMAQLLSNGGSFVGDIAVMHQDETDLVLRKWNATARTIPDESVHQLFDRVAAARGGEVALLHNDVSITYSELASMTNRLGHYLRSQGIGRGDFVGLYFHRSVDLVVGLLAVQKSGAAYVPLDPLYPLSRCATMVQDSKAVAVLTDSTLADALCGKLPEAVHVMQLDREREAVQQMPDEPLVDVHTNEDLCYAIFTSGSTGRPKGVPIAHRSLVNLLNHFERDLCFQPGDGLLAVTTICFDIAGLEIYLPLIAGGKLVLASKEQATDPEELKALMEESGARFMQATPSTWRMLLRSLWEGSSSLVALCGGEALPVDLARELIPQVGELWNVYGPTETTIWSTAGRITDADDIDIGRPMDNTQIYILDTHLKPMPIGLPGELFIAGDGLSPGYLYRDDLTLERFLPNPFGPGKMYKTGDLACWRKDGKLECLGRIDHQVKIRGYRIELGEIEAVLAQHPLLAQVVVDAHTPEGGDNQDRQLVAYVVPKNKSEVSLASLDRRNSSMTSLTSLSQRQNSVSILEDDSGVDKDLEEVAAWGSIYDEAYSSQNAAHSDPTLNFSGYDNSYTPRVPHQIPVVREWVETTCGRIAGLKPRRALEMGAGQGMLLLRLAKACELYIGADLSTSARDYVQGILDGPEFDWPWVQTDIAGAHESEKYKHRQLDTIVCNGVSMYFPSANYLREVVHSSLSALQPGGAYFLGDVRCNTLLEHFHASVQLFQAPDAQPVSALKEVIAHKIKFEKELLVEPELFLAADEELTDVAQVRLDMKRGAYHSEFSMFRYDVLYWKEGGATCPAPASYPLEPYHPEQHTLQQLEQQLQADSRPRVLAIAGIPDARLAQEGLLVDWLHGLRGRPLPSSCGELREQLVGAAKQLPALEPEDLYQMGERNGYHVEMMWSPGSATSMDVLFVKQECKLEYETVAIASRRQGGQFPKPALDPWARYTNKWEGNAADEEAEVGSSGDEDLEVPVDITMDEIREFKSMLRNSLPEYMVPGVYVEVPDGLPQTDNGKVDRKRLPPVTAEHYHAASGDYVAPKGEVQEALAELWAQLLHLPEVSATEDFFSAGGHSLLAMQLSGHIQRFLGVKLTMAAIAANSSLQDMAALIERKLAGEECGEEPSLKVAGRQSVYAQVDVKLVPSKALRNNVVEEATVWVPMDDGIQLAARLWRPVAKKSAEMLPGPALLEVNPYRLSDGTVEMDALTYPFLAAHGYPCVRLDVRGSGNSQGVLDDEYSPRVIADAKAAVEWAAQQPWCDGRVVMMGASWAGFQALQVASLPAAPDALKAVVAVCATDQRHSDDMHYMGGALLMENLSWGTWLQHAVSQPPDPLIVGAEWQKMWEQRLEQLPLYTARWLQTPDGRDAYWQQGSAGSCLDNIRVPVFAVGGTHAGGYHNSVARLAEGVKHAPVRALLGPWSHNMPHLSPLGPQCNFLGDLLDFLRLHVAGPASSSPAPAPAPGFTVFAARPTPAAPLASAAVMVPGAWMVFPSVRQAQASCPATNLALGAGGALGESTPGSIAVRSGLANGNSPHGLESGRWFTFGANDDMPLDQRRDDALATVWDGPPVEEDMAIIGAPSVHLQMPHTAAAAGGNLVARLCAVAPNGISHRVTYGVLNLRTATAHVTELRVQLDYVAYVVPKGYKLRVALSRDLFPIVWPSTQDAQPVLVACGPDSFLQLPLASCSSPALAAAVGEGAPLMTCEVLVPEPADVARVSKGAVKRVTARGGAEVAVRTVDDCGAKRLGGAAQGLVLESAVTEDVKLSVGISTAAAASCVHRVSWRTTHQREGVGGVDAESELSVEMTATDSDFVLDVEVLARANKKQVHQRQWTQVVPRNGI